MSLIDIVKQQKDNLPGSKLVAFFEKYFPVYILDIKVSLIDEKGMGILSKFILKLIKEELNEAHEMSMFLGISIKELSKELNQLVILGYIFQAPTATGQKYKLTSKGIEALEMERLSINKEETITIKMDAITGELFHVFALKTERVREDSEMLMRPSLSYPELWDLSRRYDELKKLYNEFQTLRLTVHDRYEFEDIIDIQNCYTQYKKMNLLIFERDNGEFLFQVFDGHHYAPEYEEPLAKMAKQGIEIWKMEDFDDDIYIDSRHTQEEVEGHDQTETVRQMLTSVFSREEVVEEQVTHYSFLSTTDHFLKMEEAFHLANDEVIIISPWVTNEVIHDISPAMKEFVKRGGLLRIGYGYPKDPPEKQRRTENTIKQLRRFLNSSQFKPVRLGDTHEKILICDNKFAVIGSYNWLSFRGDRKRGFTSETSICIEVPEAVQELKQRVNRRLGEKGASK